MDLSVPYEYKPNHHTKDDSSSGELDFVCKMDGCGKVVKAKALRTHAAMEHQTTRYHTDMVKRS
jgi:hypothetical protein